MNQRVTREDGLIADEQECFIREEEDQALNQRIRGHVKSNASNTLDGHTIPDMSVGARGHLANYQFTGDYAMGVNVVESLKTYRPATFRQDVSLESDHEMVCATFTSSALGGARRGRHTRHKAHKARHTRHKAHKARRTRHKAHKARRTRR